MARIEKVDYFMLMAQVVSMRATCKRRSVGCVLVDHYDHVLSTGYNGVASGRPHCIETPCPGADCLSGQGLDLCEAIHAEQNALLQCGDVYKIKSCFTTTLPCIHCLKLLMNTSCQFIYYCEPYSKEVEIRNFWINSRHDRDIEQLLQKYKIEEINGNIFV